MSDNVSANVLFHFTSSIDHLESILRDGFFPHYCPEYTLGPEDRRAASKGQPPASAIPMVCFCDLPLALIRKHHKLYGPYGIGLTKGWGLQHRVAPVIYTHLNAQTHRPVLQLAADEEAPPELRLLAAYVKPFRGRVWRNGRCRRRSVRFYDEREWRYVPAVDPRQIFLAWNAYNIITSPSGGGLSSGSRAKAHCLFLPGLFHT
ncbi:conserved hypothetical protein [Verrucomicrobia bacterium]|nr:conserved hypothetical protein [Verrucomicrobiota bacterium]